MIMKELSIEEKAQAYDKAVKIAKSKIENDKDHVLYEDDITEIFPELQENEDERIRKSLFEYFKNRKDDGDIDETWYGISYDEILAWLEKQGKETSWKPSKDEMDVLYALAYITYEYDKHKEEVITHLYQDLKREFFNGSSYENMFPNTEDGVRRRSTIQVLEYARSLDAYNQYDKADIDKNIAWLKKQGTELSVYQNALYRIATILSQHEDREGSPLEQVRSIVVDSSLSAMDFEKKELKNIEQKIIISKFKVGDIIQFKGYGHNKYTIKEVIGSTHYINSDGNRMDMSYTDANFELVSPPTNNDIKEALRTEYEKGRADAIAEVQKSAWSEEDEYVSGKLLNTVTLFNPTSSIFEKLPKEQFIERLKSFKERYTWKPSGE